jgi:hypothetical protein
MEGNAVFCHGEPRLARTDVGYCRGHPSSQAGRSHAMASVQWRAMVYGEGGKLGIEGNVESVAYRVGRPV